MDNALWEENQRKIKKEQSYRRGYMQGYAQAIRDIERGKSLQEIDDFMHKKIARWRFQTKDEKLITAKFPPVIP